MASCDVLFKSLANTPETQKKSKSKLPLPHKGLKLPEAHDNVTTSLCVTFTDSEILKGIKSFRRGSCEGSSGLLLQHFVDLTSGCTGEYYKK